MGIASVEREGMTTIVDCTLRDGGFVNNWKFAESAARSVIHRLLEACVDVVEVGYRTSRGVLRNECDLGAWRFVDEELMGQGCRPLYVGAVCTDA